MSVGVVETVEVFFDLAATGGDFFTLGDPVKGKLGDPVYVLGGEFAVDVSAFCTEYSVSRGRSRELDEIYVGTCFLRLNNYDGRFSPDAFSPTDVVMYDDENVTHNGEDVIATMAPYGTGNITPGKRIRIQAAGVTVFDGIIQSWDFEYTYDMRATVAVIAEDSLGQLGRRSFLEWTTTGGQTPGERLEDVLDRAEVDWGANRDIDDGVSTLQADLATHGSNVLNYCQLVARTDLGRLFCDRQGVLTFRDRHNLVNPTISASLTDDASDLDGIYFANATPATSSELLYTDVSVDRFGGVAQTVYDAAARKEYGIRRLDLTDLLFDSDDQSLSAATFLNGVYKSPQLRIGSVSVALDGHDTSTQSLAATLDLSQVVRVRWTPRAASEQYVADFVIEGVSHRSRVDDLHYVDYRLSPVFQAEAFVLGSDVLGRLGSGVLAF